MKNKANQKHFLKVVESSFRSLSRRSAPIIFCLVLMAIVPGSLAAQQLAAGRNKFLGCSTSNPIWPNLDLYWNQVTPGNDGKWVSVESSEGSFAWDGLDNIYNYANTNGLLFKEHNFVWGSQQPGWITSLDSAGQRAAVQQWIQMLCGRYPNLAFIDVVNEPFHSPPPYKNALGGNGATGWDWVITAFQWARQYADSGAKLLINDYNILQDNSVTTNYINLIDTLKVRGLIDGIGIQGHYFEFRSPVAATSGVYVYNVNTIKSNLDRIISATGLPVYMSEFDVDEPVDSVQLAEYQIYFPIFWDDPGVKGMTLWGYIQNDVWNTHPNTYLLRTDGSERPALQWMRQYILKGPLPVAPSLISPRSITNAPKLPRYVWNPALHATSYELQVAFDNQFQIVLIDTTVADTAATPGGLLDDTTTFYWRVCGIDSAGSGPFSSIAHFSTGTVLDVKEPEASPNAFALYQNYPNPFNPSTVITYQLPVRTMVTLKVYDLAGSVVQTLVAGDQSAGPHRATFDGSHLSSGMYFYRLQAGALTSARKLLLLK